MHRVGTRAERRTGATAIRGVTCLLAVHHVGGDGQHGLGSHGTAVGVELLDLLHEALDQVAGDVIDAGVVVTELRVLAFDLEVDGDAIFVTNRLDLGVLDGRQGVSRHGQTGDAARHGAIDVTVVQRHQGGFVAVLVVHVVDDVQGGDVLLGQPVHEVIQAIHHVVVLEVLGLDHFGFRADLDLELLVHTAVDCIQHGLGQVGTSAEELHLFADDHRRHAASDGVVIVVEVRTHQVIVLVLNGRGLDGYLGAVLLETDRQLLGPQNGQVRLRGRAHGVQGVQHTEAVLGDQGTAINAHTGQGLGCPHGVAGEQ
ncbi:hypothetical protein D3C76_576970 [compost metagenome]